MMNSLLAATPPVPPHHMQDSRFSPSRSMSTSSSSRKRKASLSPPSDDDPMATSPALVNARLPAHPAPRSVKRPRPNLVGRPLNMSRLLETLDAKSLRSVIQVISERHGTGLQDEIRQLAPRPSVSSTLQVLRDYQQSMNQAFPLGDDPASDYSYNRVKQQLHNLLDALGDFTPQFLPPIETQSATSLSFLDGATNIIHELPRWNTIAHNLAKEDAYEEISRAWACVVKEASKRGGGIQLQYGGWDEKLRRHNELSGGKLEESVNGLRQSLGWMVSGRGLGIDAPELQQSSINSNSRLQLFAEPAGSGTMGMRTGTGW